MAASRPYLGVHYPSDVVVGGVLGAVIGRIFRRGRRR
jgi:membrane-associated phospholipid phosphatase